MSRSISVLLLLLASSSLLQAQDGPRSGVIRSLEVDTVTIQVGEETSTFLIRDTTRLMNGTGRPAELDEFRTNARIMFAARRMGDQQILIGMRLLPVDQPQPVPRPEPQSQAGNRILNGLVVTVDAEKRRVIVTVGDDQLALELTKNADVRSSSGGPAELSQLETGSSIQFRVLPQQVEREGWRVVDAIRAPGNTTTPVMDQAAADALVPLPQLGAELYQGFAGGLYPEGTNKRPADHESSGLRLAARIQPLDTAGQPDANGKIVLLSVGMSNTSQISAGFEQALQQADDVNPHVQFVNGAQGGMTAASIQDPLDSGRGTQFWRVVDERLQQAKVTREQVQVIWIKQADAGPSQGFPEYAQTLQRELKAIVRLFPDRFPNVQQVYLSGRTYAGFATTRLNPEPYAYESAFSVKWLIEQQLSGDADLNFDPETGARQAPWLSWGPYFWHPANATRADGYLPEQKDYAGDGTHHSSSGVRKLGLVLLDFFRNDTATRGWFLRSDAEVR